MRFENRDGALVCKTGGETLRIEPWGKDSLRVRATMLADFTGNVWALTETPKECAAEISIDNGSAKITNGRISAEVNFAGVVTYYKDGKLILREYFRSYGGTLSQKSRCLKIVNREWKGIIGGTEYSLNVKFEPNSGEKIFGMGQYQDGCFDLKGCTLELAQRNSQISVPFAVSSLGYGFLWNNPAVGRATFGCNYTEWIARATREMDYYITVADTPKAILENYTSATGRADMTSSFSNMSTRRTGRRSSQSTRILRISTRP